MFIGVYRCSIISELPSDLSSGFIVFTYLYISTSIFPVYLPATLLHRSFCLYCTIHWFVPLSLYYDFDFFFNGPLVYTTFIMFFFLFHISAFNSIGFELYLSIGPYLFLFIFFRNFLFSPLVRTSSVLVNLFRLSFYLSIGFYPFVLVSFRLRFTFSLDRTAFSFFLLSVYVSIIAPSF